MPRRSVRGQDESESVASSGGGAPSRSKTHTPRPTSTSTAAQRTLRACQGGRSSVKSALKCRPKDFNQSDSAMAEGGSYATSLLRSARTARLRDGPPAATQVPGLDKALPGTESRDMPLPVVRGTIERRILINYRVAPEVLAELLPAPFEPMTVRGVGMAGVCLIRLGHLRPSFLPEFLGVSSE